ncbi:MAG: T9SS type A sorting domain-containing protein [Bacteroidales bacterium]|nr:T9SS type A sorting domain-containing protein [Bacteroidales bacterium]
MAVCFVIGANAQKTTKSVKMNHKKLLLDSEYQRQAPPPAINYSDDVKASVESKDIVRVDVGIAFSQRSFRREDCRVISYNKDLDLISMSFILDEETYPSIALSDGSVGIFYSADQGQTWTGPVLLSDLTPDEKRNYYLSGVLYNPSGNSVVEDAYGVYQGSAPDNAGGTLGDWDNQAFGSSTLGGANYFTEYFENTEVNHEHDGYFNQFGLTQKEDFMKCFNIWAEGPWAGFTDLKMEDIHGTFNGTGFDWNLEHSVIEIPFNIDPADGEAMWPGKWTWSDVAADMVWSDDGMIGYTWMVGAHDNMETGWWPMIFKTTDGGNDWDEVELDLFDDEVQDVFQNGATSPYNWLIFPCQDINEEFLDFTIPYFRASTGAVDAEGNLQLFADVTSHSRDFINEWEYYEGIGWVYTRAGCIFKFTVGDELIDVMLVDSLMSNQAQSQLGNDSLYCDDGWLHRLHVTKDERSEEFFVTWNDSPDGNRFVYNFAPDIKGWSYNITTGVNTDPVCFTCGTTLPYEHYWYIAASEYAFYNSVDTTFTVPMVNAVTIDDFYSNSSASADPIHVQYVDGITFDAIVPISVGVDEFSGQSNISVSQNFPNPFTNTSIVSVNLTKAADLSLEVFNLTGQKVYEVSNGHSNAGTHNLVINAENLSSGIYFYTVNAGNNAITKKMIIY